MHCNYTRTSRAQPWCVRTMNGMMLPRPVMALQVSVAQALHDVQATKVVSCICVQLLLAAQAQVVQPTNVDCSRSHLCVCGRRVGRACKRHGKVG